MPNPAPTRGRQVTVFQALALLLSFILVAGVGGVLAAGLVLPGVAAANTVTDLTVNAFDDLPTALEPTALPEKSRILAADGTLLATFFNEDRVVVPLAQISQAMRDAVIAIEDKRFYEHAGVDPKGMLRAFVTNEVTGDQQGASTLTQQYVKNVLIQAANAIDDEAERQAALDAATANDDTEGIARKLREAKLAITLEKTISKDEILEKYLNIAQFGASVYGVESAAQRYFSKSAVDLTYLEAATIAGITKNPSSLDPTRYPEADQARRDVVLGALHDQGFISDEEYTADIATPIADTLHVQEVRLGCQAAGDSVPGSGYFCDYVTKVIINDPAFGETQEDRKALLYRGGLTITTTIDPRQQAIADAEVKAGVPVGDASGVKSAISVVEPGTGKITAMAQTTDYNPAQSTPGSSETAVNFNTDQDYGGSGGFAPGSTFKPFTLTEWLKEGHSLYETVDASPLSYPMSTFNASSCGVRFSKTAYPFGNAEGGSRTTMTVLDATKNSVNSGYMAMATKIDLCGVISTASSLGVHRSDTGEPFQVLPANVLGSDNVAPLTMAAAFAAFASGGIYCKPIAITSVIAPDGSSLTVPSAGCTQALEPRIANAVNYALSNVWTGTASKVGAPDFPSAGKTGTTSHNEYTWFLGYTPRLAAAVWVGHADKKTPVQNTWVGPLYVKSAYGATIAAPTWKRFMTQALADGAENPGFAAADQKEIYGEKVSVPSVLGLSVDAATSALKGAGFTVNVSGEQVASSYAAGTVAEQSPSGTASRGSSITLKLSNGQAPAGQDQNQGGSSPGSGTENPGRNN
ncbi:transglycosylase domain-containing protein [Cellulomonas soli]|uniref:Carboxypeptidase n=1 Tax=Cellulomonas soli TaxID=931535 RepID=A0A512PHS4_9CELL|nr:transglycosylase domain-containing protein [Cellulomonas soli]NYI59239.1 membrane peptidoglycan carboxypeptidase [Cellulomonas soli]GEP70745.1 carboxypeptidase [Cellulomonas soli]